MDQFSVKIWYVCVIFCVSVCVCGLWSPAPHTRMLEPRTGAQAKCKTRKETKQTWPSILRGAFVFNSDRYKTFHLSYSWYNNRTYAEHKACIKEYTVALKIQSTNPFMLVIFQECKWILLCRWSSGVFLKPCDVFFRTNTSIEHVLWHFSIFVLFLYVS